MQLTVDFDNSALSAQLEEWMEALKPFQVGAVLVLGPNPFVQPQERAVVTVYPPRLLSAGQALAKSPDFGMAWRESAGPLAAWQHLIKAAWGEGTGWRHLWLAHGFQSLVRVEFPLPTGSAFECYLFCTNQLQHREQAAALTWFVMSMWPLLSRTLAVARSPLSPRELQCLKLAFQGLTARESGEALACSERTVNYHLANAMQKLKANSKATAIHRACSLGLI